jgi:hypothetical protein
VVDLPPHQGGTGDEQEQADAVPDGRAEQDEVRVVVADTPVGREPLDLAVACTGVP